MTDPISPFGRNSLQDISRPATSKTERRPSSPAPAATTLGADRVDLSPLTLKMDDEPAFDRAKVENIRQALERGQYPIDAKRIAENFVAIERMIKD